MLSIVIGSIQGKNYLTTFKIGSQVIRELSNDWQVTTWQQEDINLTDKETTLLIRNPYTRFYSGIVQATVFIRPKTIPSFDFKDVPHWDKCDNFFIHNLNNYW